MTEKVLLFWDHKSHIYPALGRISHMTTALDGQATEDKTVPVFQPI